MNVPFGLKDKKINYVILFIVLFIGKWKDGETPHFQNNGQNLDQ